ncbi:transmembrane protein 216-like [Anthonomus grandis grandis]|uniref:transmembrane protein 216-like n=1 Tax=Anthonomus grandis grandis TaxID=2921223 RepID=UPI0021664F56|nr:transmembrane protein 216-like [Anthonomus grandis grandis]
MSENNCKMNTSLMFEVLLYLNSYYFGLFAVCELGMNLVKYVNFPDLYHFETDFGVLMSVCGIEILRIIIASRGNLSDNKWLIILAILLTIPSVVGVVYLMFLQGEVLRFEYIICSIQLGLCVIEIITGILCLFSCCKAPEYY